MCGRVSVKGVQRPFRWELPHRTSGGIEYRRVVHDTLLARLEKLIRIFPVDQVLPQSSFRALFSVFLDSNDELTSVFVFDDFDVASSQEALEVQEASEPPRLSKRDSAEAAGVELELP